jgi:ribose-phosphate pyrophosphokinase
MESKLNANVGIISGRSNVNLAQNIVKNLNTSLVDIRLEDFGNTEVRIEINKSVRGKHIYILQTGAFNEKYSINDYIMELFGLIDACKRSSAESVTAIIPFFPYARSDKKDAPRVPIMAALMAKLLKDSGCTRIVALDLHAGQIQGFTDIPFDNLYAISLMVNHLKLTLFKDMTDEQINAKYILASPDNGGVKRVEAYAKKLKMDHVVMHKQRDHTKTSVILNSILVGKENAVKGKTVIIVDDIFDTLGTVISAGETLIKHGANDIIALATHGVFSGPAIERLEGCKYISKVIVSNSLPQETNNKLSNKIEIVDISQLLSNVIICLATGASLTELF